MIPTAWKAATSERRSGNKPLKVTNVHSYTTDYYYNCHLKLMRLLVFNCWLCSLLLFHGFSALFPWVLCYSAALSHTAGHGVGHSYSIAQQLEQNNFKIRSFSGVAVVLLH